MGGIYVDFSVNNQLNSPALNSNTFANRPAAGQIGRLFISTDTFEIYRDNGTSWDLIGGPGSSTITGSGAATQVAYFSGAQAITGNNNLWFNPTNAHLGIGTNAPSGLLHADGGANVARIILDADNNVARILSFRTADIQRWSFRVDGNETGGNAGANLQFRRYDDAGNFIDNSLVINRATGKKTFNATQNYTTGLATGNTMGFNLNVPAGTTFSSPNNITALQASFLLNLAGNATMPSGVRSGLEGYNFVNFTAPGTLTVSQAGTGRQLSNIKAGWAFTGSAIGTITHLSGISILFPDNVGSAINITNNYALYINDQNAGLGIVNYTNRWGIYQEGSADLNYLNGNLLIKSTVDNGNALQVTGQATISGNLGIGVTPSAWGVKAIDISAVGSVFADGSAFDYTSGISQNAYRSGLSTWNYKLSSVGAARFELKDNTFAWYNAGGGTAGNAITFTQAMTLDASGRLGIGTSSPSYKLDVKGGNASTLRVDNDGSQYVQLMFERNSITNSGADFLLDGTGGTFGIRTLAVYPITFSTSAIAGSPTERMRITSGGNVGIGTTSPATLLDIRTTIGTSGSIFNLSNTSAANSSNIIPIRFFTGNTFGGLEQVAAIWASNPNASSNNGGALHFGTSDNGTATTPTERMRITSGGNVGIGTANATGQSADNRALQIYGAGFANRAQIHFANSNTGEGVGDGTFIGIDSTTNFYINNAESAATIFENGGSERMRITSGGNVLIGTSTDAGQRLQVNGTARATQFNSTSGTINVAPATNTTFFTPSTAGLYMAHIYLPGNATQTWDAVIIFAFNATNILVINQTNSVNVSTVVSGTNIQVRQIGAITFTFNFEIIQIA